jgi:hypothetical protein
MSAFAAYAEQLAPAYGYVPALLAPRWPSPVGVLDVYSAHRLSVAVNWMATENGKRTDGRRASALQEVVGILVVLFGGETFLCELRREGVVSGRVQRDASCVQRSGGEG